MAVQRRPVLFNLFRRQNVLIFLES